MTPTPEPSAPANQPINPLSGQPMTKGHHNFTPNQKEVMPMPAKPDHVGLTPAPGQSDPSSVPQSSAAETARRLARELMVWSVLPVPVPGVTTNYEFHKLAREAAELLTAHEEQVARLTRERDEAVAENKYRGEMVASWRGSYVQRLDEVFRQKEELATLRARLTAAEDALRVAREDGKRLDWLDSQTIYMTQPTYIHSASGNYTNFRAAIDAALADAQRRGEPC